MGRLSLQTFRSAHRAIGTSRFEISGRPFVLARWDRDGHTILGEASPLEGYGSDSLEQALADLGSLSDSRLEETVGRLSSGFEGSALQPEDRVLPLDLLTSISPKIDSPSARFCVEMLVLGATAGECGVPLFRLLAKNRVASALPTSAVLDPLASDFASEFNRLCERGVRTFKVKCGRDAAAEQRALLQIAPAPNVHLRLDPNGAWSKDEALEFLSDVSGLPIEWVEDPTSDPTEWPELRQTIGIRIALDEPLARGISEHEVRALRPDVVVLKPMALGGFSAALRWVAIARSEGASICVSHLFDGKTAMSANLHLAFAVQTPQFAAGLGRHIALQSDPSPAEGPDGLFDDTLRCPG